MASRAVLLFSLLFFSGVHAAVGGNVAVFVKAVTSIACTDDSFICATLDWWPKEKCNYGMCPWYSASIINLDLKNAILNNAVKAFNSLRIRLGGSLQDQVVYQVGEHYDKCPKFKRDDNGLFGFTEGCLRMCRWDELNDFFQEANVTLTFGLNALTGRRKASQDGLYIGNWDPRNARDFIRYTVKSGYNVESWELGNELSGTGVSARVEAKQYAKDMIKLKKTLAKAYKKTGRQPKVLGPGGFYEGRWFKEMLQESGPNIIDAATHHIYNLGSGVDKHLIDKIQDPYFLDKEAQTFRDLEVTIQGYPWSSAWVGESGGAYNSGGKEVSNTYVNSFWYLDQLGMSSVFGTKVYCRQALIGGNYCLLNTTTFAPNPDYYSALLWDRLMGPSVLGASHKGSVYLRSYAHCSKDKPGVTVLLINLAKSEAFDVSVASDMNLYPPQAPAPAGAAVCGRREEYHLQPKDGNIQSQVMLLNGRALEVGPAGEIPDLRPAVTDGCAPVHVPARGIAFVRFRDFKAPACA